MYRWFSFHTVTIFARSIYFNQIKKNIFKTFLILYFMPSVLLCNQALGMNFAKKRSGKKMHKRILGANNGIKSGKRSKKCSKLIKKT